MDIQALQLMRREFSAIARATGRPFVTKNLNNGQRLQPLSLVLPEALIVYIKRHPLATASSILEGRLRHYRDQTRWWSVEPANVADLKGLPVAEQVVKQVWYLQRQIEQDLQLFRPQQVHVVEYENVCQDISKVLDAIREFFRGNNVVVRERDDALLPVLHEPNGRLISGEDLGALQVEVEKLTW